ncbi:MAG: hypothetical protein ACRDT6_02765 [Micromonosporaceae bacterium]
MDLPGSDLSTLDQPAYLFEVPPRLFALVADCDLAAADPCYDPERFNPVDAMVWGMEFPDAAVTYQRDPYSGQPSFGTHDSAAAAQRLFGRRVELRVAYLTSQTVTRSASGSGRVGGTTNL